MLVIFHELRNVFCATVADKSWYKKDKATVEMECMEEGYLAKIIKGDGSKEIKVGEVLSYISFPNP